MTDKLDQQCIDRCASSRSTWCSRPTAAIPGLPLGAAPMAYVLWTRFLKHHPAHPLWPDRDRFVLSAGHGSALLYSLLYADRLRPLARRHQALSPMGQQGAGASERGHTAGVEVTTGPLGQGFANAVGMAIAEAQLAARYNRPATRSSITAPSASPATAT